MQKVLILCTGNSCRSILAEALINHELKDSWLAYSAGTEPSRVNPYALKVLQELDVDTSGLRSKSVQEFLEISDLDLVITVCDHAKESCPVFPKPVKRIHISIDDPAPYSDQPEEIALPVFRKTRDEIRERIVGYLASGAAIAMPPSLFPYSQI